MSGELLACTMRTIQLKQYNCKRGDFRIRFKTREARSGHGI